MVRLSDSDVFSQVKQDPFRRIMHLTLALKIDLSTAIPDMTWSPVVQLSRGVKEEMICIDLAKTR